MTARVSCEVRDGIANINLDDGKANVMSAAMLSEIAKAFDREGNVVVPRSGRPAIFSAGFDLKVFAAGDPPRSLYEASNSARAAVASPGLAEHFDGLAPEATAEQEGSMSKETERLVVGMRHRLQLRVDERLTVPALSNAFTGFTDMPPVFATAFMIGFIEWACIELLRSALPPEFKTVGTHVDVSHVAATPIGMTVTADVELISVEGRNLRFRVRCSDSAGLIGDGTHERAIVDSARFLKRVLAKKASVNV